MSFGFGPGPAHLPQPDWFGSSSTEAQELDLASTLSLYREALRWRRKLRTVRGLEWDWQADADVVSFRRPGGWRSVTNFGPGPVAMPAGTVILTSDPAPLQELPQTPLPGSLTRPAAGSGQLTPTRPDTTSEKLRYGSHQA